MFAVARPRGIRTACSLLLMAALLAPPATAWSLPTNAETAVPAPGLPISAAAWTTDLQPRAAFPGDAAAALVSAVGCALGDISGDGLADLLVVVQDPTSGLQTIQALAGPGFQDVLWEKVSSVDQILQCAPDLDLDGTLDPILHTLGETTGTAAAGAADQVQTQVQQILDGASGAALVGRTATDAVTGAAVPVAGSAVGAAQQATGTLLPAATGAAAFLQTSATTATAPLTGALPVPLPPLPLDAVTATLTSSAELQILDAAGAVVATISIDEAGVNPLALAPVPLTGGLPDVAVLTQALAPVQQAAGGVPQLALYAADGTLSWAMELPASTGLPLLLPQAGDLNLDGVGDLVVSTVQQGVDQVPGAAYHVVSGLDGSLLFDSGPAVSGLLTALPLGQLPGGAALLQVASTAAGAASTGGSIELSALNGSGSVEWTVEVPGAAVPVNVALDAHSGDVLGFTDLTGDAVPDVAVAIQQGSDLVLQTIDGLTGEIAVNATIPDVQAVVPVVIETASAATGAAADGLALAQGGVEAVQAGATSALLALGTSATEATMTLVDPVTGAVQWVATAPVSAGADLASLSVQAAGDLDADGVQDLLVTASFNGTASTQASSSPAGSSGREARDATDGGGSPGSVSAVSGATGETLYASSAEPGASELDFSSDSTAASANSTDSKSNGVPAPGAMPTLLALAAAVAVAVVLRRRAQ